MIAILSEYRYNIVKISFRDHSGPNIVLAWLKHGEGMLLLPFDHGLSMLRPWFNPGLIVIHPRLTPIQYCALQTVPAGHTTHAMQMSK